MSTTPDKTLFAIRRNRAWKSAAEVEEIAERSKQVADAHFADELRWIRSYVIAEDDGSFGSICIYEATGADAIERHAKAVGMPAHDVWPIGNTVVIRPDPVTEPVREPALA